MRDENSTPAQRRLDRVVAVAGIRGTAPALPPRLASTRPSNNYLKLAGGPGFGVGAVFPFDDQDPKSMALAVAAAESAQRRELAMARARGYDVSQKPIRMTAYRPVEGLPVVRYVGDLIDLLLRSAS